MRMKLEMIWILVVCTVLIIPLSGQEFPFAETIDLKNYEDHYDLEKVVAIYIKEDSTYRTENRFVTVSIAPQDYCYAQGEYIKDYFCDILVLIEIKTEDEETSEEFLSYLNFEISEQRLFWDHAGNPTADRAGESLDEDNPLVVEDQYIKVTLQLMQLMPSEYNCGDCETDAATYLNFIDTIRFKLLIDYSQAQKDTIEEMGENREKYEDAQGHITLAQGYFQQGEFGKAKEEYQKAQDLFDEIGDTENSDDMQEWIDKCASYDVASENFKDGISSFEEAVATENYQEAIDTYEEAKSYFQRAQTEFDRAEDTAKSDECETWIDRCDDEIDNLKGVGTLRERLIYIIVAIVVVAGAGVLLKQLGKGKPAKPAAKRGLMLQVRNAQTGQVDSISVEPTDKIGKVRQRAATRLGMVASALLYNGRECPPDRTVRECGLADGAVIDVVPMGAAEPSIVKKKPEAPPDETREKLERLEQKYREGKISKELYENLKRKLESN
jgi:tetratricopeptide (TPR) repeat protein